MMERDKSEDIVKKMYCNHLLFDPESSTKCYSNLISALHSMSPASRAQKPFQLKCISSEYFRDLVLRRGSDRELFIDTRSCALLSVNSIVALRGFTQCWMRLTMYEEEPPPTDSGVDGEEATPETFSKKSYMMQCLVVSTVRDDFVLYVTNEKFFNISQRFGSSISNTSLTVNVEISSEQRVPGIAERVVLFPVDSGEHLDKGKLLLVLKRFFALPKHAKRDEIIEIDAETCRPLFQSSISLYGRNQVHFKVFEIGKEDGDDEGDDDLGYYIIEGKASIDVKLHVSNLLPAVHTKYIPANDKLGYEIPAVPGGLERYFLQLQKLFSIFSTETKLSVKPLILLTGPRGCGKEVVLNCAASYFGYKLLQFDCFDCTGEEEAQMRMKLVEISCRVTPAAPCVLVLDCVEFIGANVNDGGEDVAAISAFQEVLDKILSKKHNHPVIVVATSYKKESAIIPSIARMFVQTLSFEPLKTTEVVDLLAWWTLEIGASVSRDVLEGVASKTRGFFYADAEKLVRLARKFQREASSAEDNVILEEHFEKGLKIMDDLYSRKIGCARVPTVHWDDIGGLEDLKREILMALDMKTKYVDLLGDRYRLSGFLFYGPPGTGKTLVAKAVATECKFNFLSVKGPELLSMYVGQGEQNIREVFQKARDAAPCIIFFDELDSLAQQRGNDTNGASDRIVSQLLTEMDGLDSNSGIFVIGATNRPDLLDSSFLRPGRFDKLFYLGPCDTLDMLLKVTQTLIKGFNLAPDVTAQRIVFRLPDSHLITSADLYSICSNAWLAAAGRCIRAKEEEGESLPEKVEVAWCDFDQALHNFKPSITEEILERYKQYQKSK